MQVRKIMSRAIHATTGSGDAITLELSVETPAHGRTLAQLEHNAMQALGLTRAALAALEPCAHAIDRASVLLAHSPGVVEPAIRPELKRIFVELSEHVNTAQLHGEPLLRGDRHSFALVDPREESSQPLCVVLPDLREKTQALAACDLGAAANALTLAQRNGAALLEVRQAQRELLQTLQNLNQVLAAQRRGRDLRPISEPPPPNQDEGFISLIGRVRDHVLTSGGAALRVQGAPSSRAAWLVERFEKTQQFR